MTGAPLVSLLPRVEDPIPDMIGVGFIFSMAGAGGVVMLVFGSMLGLPVAELDAVSAWDLWRARSFTLRRWWGRYYEDNASHLDYRPHNRLCRRSCLRNSPDGLDRDRRRWRVRLPLCRHDRIQRFPHLA
jgi:hypothetical protein